MVGFCDVDGLMVGAGDIGAAVLLAESNMDWAAVFCRPPKASRQKTNFIRLCGICNGLNDPLLYVTL